MPEPIKSTPGECMKQLPLLILIINLTSDQNELYHNLINAKTMLCAASVHSLLQMIFFLWHSTLVRQFLGCFSPSFLLPSPSLLCSLLLPLPPDDGRCSPGPARASARLSPPGTAAGSRPLADVGQPLLEIIF
jgi:hypothetical protein